MAENQLTVDQVREVLRTVIDPELGINIIDLGLIYNIDVADYALTIQMTMTTPGCPMQGTLVRMVEVAVERLAGQRKVLVEVVWDPPWTPDRITPMGRSTLGS